MEQDPLSSSERGQAPRTLIVVPTFNEAANIDDLLRGIREHLPMAEVLFVDDSSTDGTLSKIEEHEARADPPVYLIRRERKLGLGTAYVAGFRWGLCRDYDRIVQMDADLSHDPVYLPRLSEMLDTRDVAVGSRYVAGGGTRNCGLSRRLLSATGSFYARTMLGLAVRDLTGGFNGWRREVLATLALDEIRSEGFSFQIELKYAAHRHGFSLTEVPIVFADRRAGESKMSLRVILEALFLVTTLRLRRWPSGS